MFGDLGHSVTNVLLLVLFNGKGVLNYSEVVAEIGLPVGQTEIISPSLEGWFDAMAKVISVPDVFVPPMFMAP